MPETSDFANQDTASPQDDGLLPSERENQQASQDGTGLAERARLNFVNTYYRGTLAGSTRLATMARAIMTPEDKNDEGQKNLRKQTAQEYLDIVGDLDKYDKMNPWGSSAEGLAALGGSYGGGMLSPESYLGWQAKGATWLTRTMKSAVQQGGIQAAIDPVVQYLNNKSGVGDGYDWKRTASAFGLGAIIGGGMHGITGELIPNLEIKRLRSQMATVDGLFQGAMEQADQVERLARESARTTITPETATREAEAAPAPPEPPPAPYEHLPEDTQRFIKDIQTQVEDGLLDQDEGRKKIADLVLDAHDKMAAGPPEEKPSEAKSARSFLKQQIDQLTEEGKEHYLTKDAVDGGSDKLVVDIAREQGWKPADEQPAEGEGAAEEPKPAKERPPLEPEPGKKVPSAAEALAAHALATSSSPRLAFGFLKQFPDHPTYKEAANLLESGWKPGQKTQADLVMEAKAFLSQKGHPVAFMGDDEVIHEAKIAGWKPPESSQQPALVQQAKEFLKQNSPWHPSAIDKAHDQTILDAAKGYGWQPPEEPVTTPPPPAPEPTPPKIEMQLRGTWSQLSDEDRELLHMLLEAKLKKKGKLTRNDIPVEYGNKIDTGSWMNLKDLLENYPQQSVDALVPKEKVPASPPKLSLDVISTFQDKNGDTWTYSFKKDDFRLRRSIVDKDGNETVEYLIERPNGDQVWSDRAGPKDDYVKINDLEEAKKYVADELPKQPPEPRPLGMWGHDVTDPNDPGAWKKVGGQKGSNKGGTYEDSAGEKYYVKTPQTEDHARNELLANKLYVLAGADVPENLAINVGGKPSIASRMLPDSYDRLDQLVDGTKQKDKAIQRLRYNFAADAWLSNYDVIGLAQDNVMVAPDGTPFRIDQGGALRYRAQGKPKTDFGSYPNEFFSMRDPAKAPQAAPIFKPMTDQDLVNSINRVLMVSDGQIYNAIDNLGPAEKDIAYNLAQTLVERKKTLKDIRDNLKQNIATAQAKAAATAAAPPAKPTKFYMPIKWEKGQPEPVGPNIPDTPKLNSVAPLSQWNKVSGQDKQLAQTEGPVTGGIGKKASSGVVIQEPDGRVWIVKPKGEYGGYKFTFPKGGISKGLNPQANAIKEAFEETGLRVKITGLLGDFEGDSSNTRFYTGERIGGTPMDHGKEAEAVHLVSPSELYAYLNKPRDHAVAEKAYPGVLKIGQYGPGVAQPVPKPPKLNITSIQDSPQHYLKMNMGNVFTDAQVDAMSADAALSNAKKYGYKQPGEPTGEIPTAPAKSHPSGLAMDEKSRLERAEQLGFDTSKVWYHGANSKFDAFDITKWHDEPAIFLSDSPVIAKKFGSKAYPMFTRAKNILTVEPTNGGMQHYGHSKFKKAIQQAKKDGYDAVLFKQVADAGGVGDQLAILNTNTMRSIHAAFEPAEVEHPNLAAMKPGEGKYQSPEEFPRAYEDMMNETRDATVDAQERGEVTETPEAPEGPTPDEAKAFLKKNPNLDPEFIDKMDDATATELAQQWGYSNEQGAPGQMAAKPAYTGPTMPVKAYGSSQPLQPSVFDNRGASSAFRQQIADATKLIPEAHRKLLGNIKIYTAKKLEGVFGKDALKQMKEGIEEGALQGGFTLQDGSAMGLFETHPEKGFLGLNWNVKSPINVEHVTLHEIGHMMAVNGGLDKAYTDLVEDAVNRMTPAEKAKAGYLTQPQEAFAEMYAAAFAPNVDKFFGGMSRERVEQLFAEPLAHLRSTAQTEGAPELQAMMGREPERIVGTSFRYGGKLYSGANHYLAMEEARKAGVDMGDLVKNAEDGFITSTGRFVDRKQAVAIADAADQWRGPFKPSAEELETFRRRGITREALQPLSGQPPELQAMARRQSGKVLSHEPQPTAATPTTTGANAVMATQRAAVRDLAIRSLQQQTNDLAEALDMPVRQGRVAIKGALGTYNSKSGVARIKEVSDLAVVAHEAGHAIEQKIGQDVTDLINNNAGELIPLDYDYPNKVRPAEGFAEYVRHMIGDPAFAHNQAPTFDTAFRAMLADRRPDILKSINDAAAGFKQYNDASPEQIVGSAVRSEEEEPKGIAAAVQTVKKDGFFPSIQSVMATAYKWSFDKAADVPRAMRSVAAAIANLEGTDLVSLKAIDNPEVHVRMLGRATQAAVVDLMKGVMKYGDVTRLGPSLRDALVKATGNKSQWGSWDDEIVKSFADYLVARRGEYLWRRYEAGDLPNPPAAFSKVIAQQAMAELESKHPTFSDASDMVHDFNRQLLQKRYDAGLIDKTLFDEAASHEFYVPYFRDMSDKPLARAGAGGASPEGPGMTQTIKAIRGSSRDIINPLESIIAQTFLVNRTIRHNDMVKAFVNYFGRAGIEGGKFVEPVPAMEANKYTFPMADAIEKAAVDKGMTPLDAKLLASSISDQISPNGDPLVGSFFRMEPSAKRGEPLVFYRDGGQLRAARFMTESEGMGLYELVTAMPHGLSDLAAKLLAVGAGTLRAGITTNPVFMLTNFIRDQIAASILRPDYIPFYHGIQGIASELAQDFYAEGYAVSGGVSAGAHIAPLEPGNKMSVNALKRSGYLSHRLQDLHGLLELASVTEAGTRNSIFKEVYDAKVAEGLSPIEAMWEAGYQAQDILDFSRNGSKLEAARALTPFFNAHIQGLDKARRVLIDPIVRRAVGGELFESDREAFKNAMLAWAKFAGVGGVFGAAWAAIHQDDPYYRNAHPELIGTHFVTSVNGNQVLIPKPFELALGITAGEYAFKRLMQEDPRSAAQFADAAWEVIKPPLPFVDNPLLKTSYELMLGRSTFPNQGRDIVPDSLKGLMPSEQYTERTSKLAKEIGKLTNVSPLKVEYAIGGYFGLWGRDAMALSNGFEEDRPVANLADHVFLRRFIKDPTKSSDISNRFWGYTSRYTGSLNQAATTYDEFINRRSPQGNADARNFLGTLDNPTRAFVTLKSGANDDGKPAFNAEDKMLHPMERAYKAITVLNGVSREMSKNSFAPWSTGEGMKISSENRGRIQDDVNELKRAEQFNALIIMKTPGFANQGMIDTTPIMAKINKISPAVAEDIANRYATNKIYATRSVAAAYPSMEKRLLREGSEAYLSDLSGDAKADGYEFSGEHVRRPLKLRGPILGAPAQAM